MKLVRGWEKQYMPDNLGGVRLSKARLYRAIGEEEGLGDAREGEIRVGSQVAVTRTGDTNTAPPMSVSISMEPNDPELQIENLELGERREVQYAARVEDSRLDSPLLFCLSREPATKNDWEMLRAALPERYDRWTITENVADLSFEIECGIKRWMALNEITEHTITRYRGWVAYHSGATPPSTELSHLGEVAQLTRWFRKRKTYSRQQEYRLGWAINCPQLEKLPDALEIELTKTGLGLFKPWKPPEH